MSHPGIKELQFIINAKAGVVSGLLQKPETSKALLVLAHGAGAGMWHKFMNDAAAELARRGVATFALSVPLHGEAHQAARQRSGDDLETVRAAVATAQKVADGLPLFAGGKSMGGRMTSLAAAQEPLAEVRGWSISAFRSMPWENRRRARRAFGRDQYSNAVFPGSRDGLADLKLLKPLCANTRKAGRALRRRRRRSFVSHAQERANDRMNRRLARVVEKAAEMDSKNALKSSMSSRPRKARDSSFAANLEN